MKTTKPIIFDLENNRIDGFIRYLPYTNEIWWL